MAAVEEDVGGLELDVDDGEQTRRNSGIGPASAGWLGGTVQDQPQARGPGMSESRRPIKQVYSPPPHPQDSAKGELCSLDVLAGRRQRLTMFSHCPAL